MSRITRTTVAIVGGGLTGLWTAYYLAEADPTLDVRVVEAEFAGFGASGRNGGWLSSELADAVSRQHFKAAPHLRADDVRLGALVARADETSSDDRSALEADVDVKSTEV